MEMYCLTVLETTSPKSRCHQGRFLLEAPGKGPSCLFQRLGAPGVPGLVATSLPSLPLSSRGFSCVCVSSFSEDTCHIGLGPTLMSSSGSHLQRFCIFPNKTTFSVTWHSDFNTSFGGTRFNPWEKVRKGWENPICRTDDPLKRS